MDEWRLGKMARVSLKAIVVVVENSNKKCYK